MTNSKIKTNTPPKKKAANIQVDKLRTFEGHPFKVLDNEDMGNLIVSIRQQGIISPLIVRAIESTDEYEVISGHRRLHAAIKAGLSEVPALIYPLDRNEAMIAVVDKMCIRDSAYRADETGTGYHRAAKGGKCLRMGWKNEQHKGVCNGDCE